METNQQKQITTFRNMNRFEKYSNGVFSLSDRHADRFLLIQPSSGGLALITYAVDGDIVFSTRQNIKQPFVVVLDKLETIANLSN